MPDRNQGASRCAANHIPPAALLIGDGEPVQPGELLGDTPVIARGLLGQALCRMGTDGIVVRWALTELEVYSGFDDRASHAHRGVTPRNRVMFGPPGNWYVYLCYGVHWLLNLVTGDEGFPAAILIRGAGALNGPGRVTRSLRIDGAFNRTHASPETGLWIERIRPPVPESEIHKTPRIGVDYAGAPWREVPWRFVWKTHSP